MERAHLGEQVADLLKAIGQVTRLAILKALRHGEMCVSDPRRATGQGQSNISKHLTFLRRPGVLTARRQGMRGFYRVARPEVFALVDAAQAVVRAGPECPGPSPMVWPAAAEDTREGRR